MWWDLAALAWPQPIRRFNPVNWLSNLNIQQCSPSYEQLRTPAQDIDLTNQCKEPRPTIFRKIDGSTQYRSGYDYPEKVGWIRNDTL